MIALTRRLVLAFLLATPAFGGETLTDAAGRVVEVPARPERVFAAGPPAAVLLYALKPGAMVGWVRAPKPQDRPFLRPEVADLPELGRLTGRGGTLNLEGLLVTRPDLIVDYGTVNPTYIDLADRVQDQAGVPYVLIDGGLDDTPRTIRQMAGVLGVPERGEALAAHAERVLADTDAVLARVPQGDRPRVYLARGPEGIETAGPASVNAEVITRIGAHNVAETDSDGLAVVSPEQVQAWAPDVILATSPDFAANVGKMPEWQGIPAVAQGRVYLIPAAPFGFVDAPPSVNRLAGLIWLSHRLYPGAATGDLRDRIAGFYELFYGQRPDEAALRALLGE
ncbi:iron ABC transporter substrate-binding protein [Paenirhodobacter sp.]|uniref:iron ABC transporter substrate-binding protein n=1 Tax=Paenirhodobacter sp. TaxID=1965326 RepID=UPI003B41D6C3